MKNAVIFHGTSASPKSNWFEWLKEHLEANSYDPVWLPQLPNADTPDMATYKEFIFDSGFNFNEETLAIGHSSGAVTVLSVLEALPEGVRIDTAVMVGVYRPEIKHFSSPEALDISKIKGKAKRFVFLHSDNDPYCPLEHAEYFAKELGGELVVIPGQDHFSASINPKHTTLPELIGILNLKENHED